MAGIVKFVKHTRIIDACKRIHTPLTKQIVNNSTAS